MELTKEDPAAGFDDMLEPVEEKAFTEVTMQELDNKIRQLHDYKNQLEDLELQAGPIKERKANLEEWLKACFKEHGRKSYRSAYGNLVISDKYSVTVPKGKDNLAFRKYLEEKGTFDATWTVNSQKLNSWYKKEMEAAQDAGKEDFKIPGIGDPVLRQTLALKKR